MGAGTNRESVASPYTLRLRRLGHDKLIFLASSPIWCNVVKNKTIYDGEGQ
jgi:hypothetical protein